MLRVLMALSLLGCALADDPIIENGVLVLTDENFDDELVKHDDLLVMFYADFCQHCTALRPKFDKAAAQVANHDHPIVFAKVEAYE